MFHTILLVEQNPEFLESVTEGLWNVCIIVSSSKMPNARSEQKGLLTLSECWSTDKGRHGSQSKEEINYCLANSSRQDKYKHIGHIIPKGLAGKKIIQCQKEVLAAS